jgi:hypothetical protein
MSFIFFDIQGIVHAEFMPPGTTVNSEGLSECLQNDVQWKVPEKWNNRPVLHHDNGPCHTSVVIRQFLADKKLSCVLIMDSKGNYLEGD